MCGSEEFLPCTRDDGSLEMYTSTVKTDFRVREKRSYNRRMNVEYWIKLVREEMRSFHNEEDIVIHMVGVIILLFKRFRPWHNTL